MGEWLKWLKHQPTAMAEWFKWLLKEKLMGEWLKWLKHQPTANTAGRMQYGKAIVLFLYLLIFGGVMAYCVYGLWAAEPKAPQPIPVAEPPYPASEKPPEGMPKIKLLDPPRVTIGIAQASIRIFGYNFMSDSQVRFNGAERTMQYVNEHQLVVPLVHPAFDAPGVVAVQVVNGAKSSVPKISDAMTLEVAAAGSITGVWRVFGCPVRIQREAWLILLVFFTGALGGCMSALKSLADYIGERTLIESWFTFYLAQPLVGAGIAFIFYMVIRGGFLASANFDTTAVNPFGVLAVAALVGMFSDIAIMKLKEVFLTLFKPDDTRSGKLGKLAITIGPKLPDAHAGSLYRERLEASGGTPPYTWATVTDLPYWLTLDAAAGVLTGTPPFESLPAAAQAVRLTLRVTDSTGTSVTAELALTVN